jgi:hypothetical protein
MLKRILLVAALAAPFANVAFGDETPAKTDGAAAKTPAKKPSKKPSRKPSTKNSKSSKTETKTETGTPAPAAGDSAAPTP